MVVDFSANTGPESRYDTPTKARKALGQDTWENMVACVCTTRFQLPHDSVKIYKNYVFHAVVEYSSKSAFLLRHLQLVHCTTNAIYFVIIMCVMAYRYVHVMYVCDWRSPRFRIGRLMVYVCMWGTGFSFTTLPFYDNYIEGQSREADYVEGQSREAESGASCVMLLRIWGTWCTDIHSEEYNPTPWPWHWRILPQPSQCSIALSLWGLVWSTVIVKVDV